jgi:hypothetical protein
MSLLHALPLLVLLAEDTGKPWKPDGESDGVAVMRRERAGTDKHEMKASGIVDAPPDEVLKIVRDFPNHKKIMAYTDKSDVIATEEDGKVVHLYILSAAPLIDKRDYALKYVDVSDWQDGKGYYQLSFSASDKVPPETKGVVRVKTIEGYWKMEPREEGKKTFLTYYLFIDPGGSLPTMIVNSLSGSGLKDVIKAVRKSVAPAK